jgi:hypothetical protein
MDRPSDPDDQTGVPAPVRALLRDQVQSVETLEVLQLVSGDSQRSWTAPDTAAELKTSVDVSTEALQRLQAGGLMSAPSPGAYRFAPATPALAAAVGELRRCYAADRLSILKLMNALALEQMRTAMLRTLAEAFRLRRREP